MCFSNCYSYTAEIYIRRKGALYVVQLDLRKVNKISSLQENLKHGLYFSNCSISYSLIFKLAKWTIWATGPICENHITFCPLKSGGGEKNIAIENRVSYDLQW